MAHTKEWLDNLQGESMYLFYKKNKCSYEKEENRRGIGKHTHNPSTQEPEPGGITEKTGWAAQ